MDSKRYIIAVTFLLLQMMDNGIAGQVIDITTKGGPNPDKVQSALIIIMAVILLTSALAIGVCLCCSYYRKSGPDPEAAKRGPALQKKGPQKKKPSVSRHPPPQVHPVNGHPVQVLHPVQVQAQHDSSLVKPIAKVEHDVKRGANIAANRGSGSPSRPPFRCVSKLSLKKESITAIDKSQVNRIESIPNSQTSVQNTAIPLTQKQSPRSEGSNKSTHSSPSTKTHKKSVESPKKPTSPRITLVIPKKSPSKVDLKLKPGLRVNPESKGTSEFRSSQVVQRLAPEENQSTTTTTQSPTASVLTPASGATSKKPSLKKINSPSSSCSEDTDNTEDTPDENYFASLEDIPKGNQKEIQITEDSVGDCELMSPPIVTDGPNATDISPVTVDPVPVPQTSSPSPPPTQETVAGSPPGSRGLSSEHREKLKNILTK